MLAGSIRVFLREPKEEVRLGPGETYTVPPRRPHLVVNGGDSSATFLVLQGVGEYDFVPLVPLPKRGKWARRSLRQVRAVFPIELRPP